MTTPLAQSASSSRPRNQTRKKANDDASYFGPSSGLATGSKRQAAERAEGEPRVKRKRVEGSHVVANNANLKKDTQENEPRKSLVDFQKLPTQVLHRYLVQFDIVPQVHPSPLTAEDPPPPSSLTDPQYQSRPPSPPAVTPANRPNRNFKDNQHGRRRSSRLVEEEIGNRVPILADVAELHTVLASIVERHFREYTSINGREEVDTLAAFMCAVEKAKGNKNKLSL